MKVPSELYAYISKRKRQRKRERKRREKKRGGEKAI